ncbi:MAG: hypothetical protein ACRCW1_11470 [Anaerotignaceae bacterium]
MKFITEEDLRDIYRREPFTTYELEQGTRLTPGARQFLADRGINMFDDEPYMKKYVVTTSDDLAKTKDIKAKDSKAVTSSPKNKKVICRMKTLEATFFETAHELLTRDVLLAESVIGLGKDFGNIKALAEGKELGKTLTFQNCSGIKENNIYEEMEDCFEITQFHIQLTKGKEIIILHKLRCELREFLTLVSEVYENEKLCEEITKEVNKVINLLSQMICAAVGGKTCQKKD